MNFQVIRITSSRRLNFWFAQFLLEGLNMQHLYSGSPSGLQQQQPQRFSDRHQQQISGAGEFQPRRPRASQSKDDQDKSRKIGEGSYEGTRYYQQGIESYLKKADVKSDARAAKPDNNKEVAELEQAEKEGLSHTKAPGQ